MTDNETEPRHEPSSNNSSEVRANPNEALPTEIASAEADFSTQANGSSAECDLDATLNETEVNSVNAVSDVSVFGEYELLHEIARGGMGVVYKARHKKLNRIVALKMILSGQLASHADVQRFYTEAEAAAKLQHPGIVPIYEIGETNGQHFFSMGFIDGPSLADRVRSGPMRSRDAAVMMVRIAEAVAHAHDNHIVHRDLKPANILIDAGEQPKVTDFGLAKKIEVEDGLTASGQIMGTPGYMPPEQADGRAKYTGATADVYSLGAILYALLTGRAPFHAESVMDTLVQVIEQEPVHPRHHLPSIDRDLERVCLKCLEKAPEDRYQSASHLVDDLRRYLDGSSLSISGTNTFSHVIRQLKRSKHEAQFGQWGVMLRATAPVIMAAETGMYVFCRNGPQPQAHLDGRLGYPDGKIAILRIVQCVVMGLVVWKYRKNWSLKVGTAERQLLSTCVGFFVALLSAMLAVKAAIWCGYITDEVLTYLFLLVLSGLFFSSLAANYWGQCYTISAAFYCAAPLVLLKLAVAPLIFGGLWACVLLLVGTRLVRYNETNMPG